MSQQELLDKISKNPGILQKDVISSRYKHGENWNILHALIKKGCVTRKLIGRCYALYATGKPL